MKKGTMVNTKFGLAKVLLVTLTAVALAGCFDDKKDSSTGGGTGTGGSGTPTTPTTPTPTAANRAPNLTGAPVTAAKVGVTYSFQPAASDPDGDRLTFQVTNKPSWATFDPASGRLQGTPPTGSNGTYAAIQISASDGKATTSTAPFDINVAFPAVGSTTLSWQAPSTNEDGSPLVNLAGYVVRYGRDPGTLDQRIAITNPSITQYVVDNLVEGVWYFSLSSINSTGTESRQSGVVSTTIGG